MEIRAQMPLFDYNLYHCTLPITERVNEYTVTLVNFIINLDLKFLETVE